MEPSIRAMIGPRCDEGIAHEIGALLGKIQADKTPSVYFGRSPHDDYSHRALLLPERALPRTSSPDLSDRADLTESRLLLSYLQQIPGFYQNEGPARGYSLAGNSSYSSCSGHYQ